MEKNKPIQETLKNTILGAVAGYAAKRVTDKHAMRMVSNSREFQQAKKDLDAAAKKMDDLLNLISDDEWDELDGY